MIKKLAAAVVSLAVLFGMAVRTDAGTAIGGSMVSKQSVIDKNDGRQHLRTAKKDAEKSQEMTVRVKGKELNKAIETDFVLLMDIEFPMLKADSTSSTKITVTVYKRTGEIYEAADGIEVKFSVKPGRMGAGAEIIASDKFPDLNGCQVIGSVLLYGSEGTSVSQKITYSSSAIKKGKTAYGSSFLLNARTTGTGKLTYQSSNTKILSVNTNGKVTVKGYGPVSVKIKAAGGNGYKAAVRRISLTAVPHKGKITKAVWQKNGVRIQWKPEKTADGYEYAIAYNKKFSGQSRKKTKKTGLILTKYKTGTKQMFIKVRTYKKAGKKIYYGSWSKPQSVKLKKSRKTGQASFVIAD